MRTERPDSFNSRGRLRVGDSAYRIVRLDALEKAGMGGVSRLPFSIRVLLENLLRHEDGVRVTRDDIEALTRWQPCSGSPSPSSSRM